MLALPGETDIPWAVFDAGWYVRTYPEAAVAGDDSRAPLNYYLQVGQEHAHSPNRLFDEAWHRRAYPQIAQHVQAGLYRSAFDAYCRRGALDRSAHWLFDEVGYRVRYPDLTNEVLAGAGIANGYDHYLRHGLAEHRGGHPLLDQDLYLSRLIPAEVEAIRQDGVFRHYLSCIETHQPEPLTSIYFDPHWYLENYPEVARAIEQGRWKCALHHYLCNDRPTAYDPLGSFSEAWYLRRDPGLLKVIESRHFRNGYMHFLQFGAAELRSPAEHIDLGWYAAQRQVQSDLQEAGPDRLGLKQAGAANAFAHWLTIGRPAGIPSSAPESEKISIAQARVLFQRTAAAQLPASGRFGYNFECAGPPAVTVVIVVRDSFATTMSSIASLRTNTASDIELIIVDRGSQDETRFISPYVPGAKFLKFDRSIGWSSAADAGWRSATSSIILFLSSEAQLLPGAVERARARLLEDASVGATSGMILRPDGLIAQAGGILWNDGGLHDYQHGASPLAPEANFVREVEFCAPAFLMVRTAALSGLDGFDPKCREGYDVVDLCLRIRQKGFRTIYDPSVMVVAGVPIQPVGGCGDHFRSKHVAALALCFPPSGTIQVFARHTNACARRVLFIEDTVPVRRIGSGFVRANDLIAVMASLGVSVTVFPVNGCDQPLSRVFGDLPESVEVMHTLSLDRLAAFLEARLGYYDTVWVARAHNLKKAWFALTAYTASRPRIVLDTEAVAPIREAVQADLADRPYDLEAAMAAMRADADICQQIVAVTRSEAEMLRRHGFENVSVIGHMIQPRPTTRSFADRAGLLFVGAIHTGDSPNLDGLFWFVNEVLPLIEADLKRGIRLTIAGYVAPGIDLRRLGHHPSVTLLGPVADLTSLYDAHRVFVAPTRYAAGAPYKVLEAASRGLPVVATELLRTELDWVAEQEIFSATDALSFARGVLQVHGDERLWSTIREGALHRLERATGREDFARAVKAVLGFADIQHGAEGG